MSIRAKGHALTLAAVLMTGVLAGAPSLSAQDIEVAARTQGIPLPAAYYDRVQQDPTAYEFERALFRRTAPARTSAFGEVRLPVILGLFADSEAEPRITADMVRASLFEGPSERGTITDSYLEMSRGALTVTGDVIGWVRTGLTMSEVVGSDFALGADARVGDWIVDMLTQVDGDIDFAQYDNDGPDGLPNSGDDDGFVDVVTVEFLEVSASCGGPAIWPHRWTVQGQTGAPFQTNDIGINGQRIRVQDYITQSASPTARGRTSSRTPASSRTSSDTCSACRTGITGSSASLGPSGRRWVMGCWALMAAGSWGCGPVGVEHGSRTVRPTWSGFSKSFTGVDRLRLEVGRGVERGRSSSNPSQIDGRGRSAFRWIRTWARTSCWIEFRASGRLRSRDFPASGVLMYKRGRSTRSLEQADRIRRRTTPYYSDDARAGRRTTASCASHRRAAAGVSPAMPGASTASRRKAQRRDRPRAAAPPRRWLDARHRSTR